MTTTRAWACLVIVPAAILIFAAGCKSSPTVASNGLGVPVPAGLDQAAQPPKETIALPDIRRLGARKPAATQEAVSMPPSPEPAAFLPPGASRLDLDPWKVIFLTFQNAPAIKVAYLKYAAEKARYDYIIATWTSSTPGFSVGPTWERLKDSQDQRSETFTQRGTVFLDQNFMDTSRLHLFADLLNEDSDNEHAAHPSGGGNLRFPLWGSREALQRSSEQIFQQNRVNDAQLEYVKSVRDELKWGLYFYYQSMGIQLRIAAVQRMIDDLQRLYDRMTAAGSPPADLQRLQASITSNATDLRSRQSNFDVEVCRMKRTVGLPMDLAVTVADELFNPFGDPDQQQLLELSYRTDPEIATLRNAVKNAELALALAEKGRLDVAVNVGGTANLQGSGRWEGRNEYSAFGLLEVRFIDPRISHSLARESSADIARYQQDIRQRRSEIYVGAMEPIIRARSLTSNMADTKRNIERYRGDFVVGLEQYFAGRMNIDDLIRRRESLMNEEIALADARTEFGVKMAELAQATGKYFEILAQGPATQPAAQAQPAAHDPLPVQTRPALDP
jgi:outer membrane protein TolC